MIRRAAGLLTFLLMSVAGTPASSARAAEDEAPALIGKARAAMKREDAPALQRLVAADRLAAYEGVDRLLMDEATAADPVVDALAAAYAAVTGEGCLKERAAIVRSWSPEQRRRHREALAAREKAREALDAGQVAEARRMARETMVVFEELNDLRMIGRSHAGFAALAMLAGNGEEALAELERAVEVQRRAGDLRLAGQIALNRSYLYLEVLHDPERTRSVLIEALPIARALRDEGLEIDVLMNLGETALALGDFDQAEQWALQTLEKARQASRPADQGRAWSILGDLADRQGREDDSQRAFARAFEFARQAGSRPEQVRTLSTLIELKRRSYALKEARALLVQMRSLAEGIDDPRVTEDLQFTEAMLTLDEGRPREAIALFGDLLRGTDESHPSEHIGKIHFQWSAALMDLGEYAEAEVRMRRAIDHATRAGRPDISAAYNCTLGRLLFELGEWPGAFAALDAAAADYAASGREEGRPAILEVQGWMRFRTGDRQGARAALAEAERLYDAPRMLRFRSFALQALAEVELSEGTGRLREASEWIAKARAIGQSLGDDDGLVLTELIEARVELLSGDPVEARLALRRAEGRLRRRGLAQLDWQVDLVRGRLAEASGDPQAAIAAYERSIAEVERLRRVSGGPQGRAAILEDRVEPYRALADLHRRRGNLSRAWRIARAGRARTFVEGLALPPGPDDAAVLPARVDPKAPRPEPAEVAASERLLAALSPGEALVDLHADETGGWAFVARRDGLTMRRIEVPADALDAARHPGRPGSDGQGPTRAWRASMARLGQAVLEPLEADLVGADAIYIVPGGPLHGLPLGALALHGKALAERFSVSLLPAADLLLVRERERSMAARGPATLCLGDPATPEPLPRLQGAAREVESIARREGGCEVLMGRSASESAFKQRANRFGRIHLAAHGRVDRLSPRRSFVALAGGEGEDGRLEASEIARLRLSGPTVVLSGCEMGREEGLVRGDTRAEERSGIARAFLSAGAETVIAVLWEVEDAAAASIMPELHARLDGNGAAEAVARLQRGMIAGEILGPGGERLDHPFYWAGLSAWGASASSARNVRKLEP